MIDTWVLFDWLNIYNESIIDQSSLYTQGPCFCISNWPNSSSLAKNSPVSSNMNLLTIHLKCKSQSSFWFLAPLHLFPLLRPHQLQAQFSGQGRSVTFLSFPLSLSSLAGYPPLQGPWSLSFFCHEYLLPGEQRILMCFLLKQWQRMKVAYFLLKKISIYFSDIIHDEVILICTINTIYIQIWLGTRVKLLLVYNVSQKIIPFLWTFYHFILC